MPLDKDKSVVTTVIKKRIRITTTGVVPIEPDLLDIEAADNKLYLYQNGKPIPKQTPQPVKTVGGQTIFGVGDIPLPEKVSDLQNDSGFVTNLVNDLVNYYTSEQIDVKLSNLGDLKLKVVDALPEADKAEENVLYLLTSDYKVYAQYFWDEKGWHLVGAENTDLSDYYTKEEIDLLIKASADAALSKSDFDSFKTTNTAAIADAKKAGTDAASSLNSYKTANDAKVSANASAISALQEAVKAGVTFKGRLDKLPEASVYNNGDLIIVGTKEYICLETTSSGNTVKAWVELGDEGTHLTKATADGYYVAKNAAIAAGTGTKISYDSKGLVTGSTGLSASDIPDLDTSKIVSGTLPDARIASAGTWNEKQDKAISIAGITATTVDNALKELPEAIAKKQEKGDKGDSGKSLFLSSDEPFASYTLVDNTDMVFTTTLTANPTITIPSDFTGCIAGVEFVNKASATALTIVNNSGIAFAKFRTIVNGTDRTSSRLAKTDDTHYSLTISKNSTIQSVFKATALGLDIDIREMDYKEES